jgi:hypothetical protein
MSAITLTAEVYEAMSKEDRKALSKVESFRTLILDFEKARSVFADETEFDIMGEKLTLGGVAIKAILGSAISYEDYTNNDKKNGEHVGPDVLVASQSSDAWNILRQYQEAKQARGEKFSLQKADLIHIIEAEMRAAL